MKKIIKEKVVDIITIVTNIVISILMFCPIYHDRATLPGFDGDGNQITIHVLYEKTPYERLTQININWSLIIAFALFGVGVILSVISYIKKEKKLNLSKNIVLIASTFVLVLLLLIASFQVVNY